MSLTYGSDWRMEIRVRLAAVKLRPEREAEIVEEVAQHLDDRYREMRAVGRDHEAAVAAAWRELEASGVLEHEVARSEQSQPLELPPPGAPARGRRFSALLQDTRYAVRSLSKQPAFAATVILALALSIGPVTAIVSLGNWLLWRPLPGVAAPDRLGLVGFGTRRDGDVSATGVSYLNLADIRSGLTMATGLAGVSEEDASLVVGEGTPRFVGLGEVSGDFFDVLGVRPVAGRVFNGDDDRLPVGAPLAVVSSGFAAREFGSPEAAIRQRFLLNRQPFTVIGVAPADFSGITHTSRIDVWITGATNPYLRGRRDAGTLFSRTQSFYRQFAARLAPGASFTQLEAELGTLARRLEETYPNENAKYKDATARVFPGLSLDSTARPGMRSMVNVLLSIAVVLLVLGCANVANMLIARAIRREPELATRQALGASVRRLLQLQLTESCLLALGGAAVGIGFAVVLKSVIQQLLFPLLPGELMPIDRRVLGMTLAAALVTGGLAGLAPAWLTMRSRQGLAGAAVRSGSGRTASRVPRLRGTLAVVQLALSLTLLVGALLLVATLRNLRAVDPGFDPENLSTITVRLASEGYTADRATAFSEQLHRALETQSSLQAVAAAYNPPFGSTTFQRVLPPGVETFDQALRVQSNGVSHTYFATTGTAILRGRAFTPEEAFARTPVDSMPVVISESLARRLFGDVDPVGGMVRMPGSPAPRQFPIVGVARDVYAGSLSARPEPFLYLPLGRYDLASISVSVIVRSTDTLPAVTAIVRATAGRIDRVLPLLEARPVSAQIDRSLRQQRVFGTMLGWVSVLAFVLAAVGLHGLVSQTTIERAREFGIRLAMGAQRADIARLVVRWVCLIAGIGTMVGLVLAAFGSRLVASLLFGVTAIDPIVYSMAVVMMVCIVALAAAWPAFRATRVDPVDVLRAE